MHSFGEVILHMCNLDQPFMGVKEPDTWGFMTLYQTYNPFGFAFRIFRFGRSDQVVVVVLVIFTNTRNNSGSHWAARYTTLKEITPQIAAWWLLKASCTQSCGTIKLISGICCRWDWDFVNLLKRYGEIFGKWRYMRCESDRTQWHPLACLWGAPSRQGYSTNCPRAMTTFNKTMGRHRCETPWDIIKHLEREELFHICYSYGPTVWVWKRAWECLR